MVSVGGGTTSTIFIGNKEERRRLQGYEGAGVCLTAQHVANANGCVATGVCELHEESGDAAGTGL